MDVTFFKQKKPQYGLIVEALANVLNRLIGRGFAPLKLL